MNKSLDMLAYGAAIGFLLFMQAFVFPCGSICKEAYIRTAIKDPAWSKQVWEEISERLEKKND